MELNILSPDKEARHGDSFLAKRFQCVVLPPAMVFVGVDVKTAN